MPSATRNFFGHIVDRLLPGSNYNPQTGQYSNIGSGIAGLGAGVAATLYGGPMAGALVRRGINHYLTNQQGGGLSMAGPLNAPIPMSPYTGGMFNLGAPNVGQQPQGNGLDGTIPLSPYQGHMFNIGRPQIGGGGGGVSQTTNGFTTAFRGGGDVYDPAEFIQALRTKGGNATQ